jgi:RsiW-degrading membrane proteinase PrsW (M82 family)
MLEFFINLLSSFLRIKNKPCLTFFLRTIIISVITALFLIFFKSSDQDIMKSLNWLLSCSLFFGLVISFIAGISEIGRENVEKSASDLKI